MGLNNYRDIAKQSYNEFSYPSLEEYSKGRVSFVFVEYFQINKETH